MISFVPSPLEDELLYGFIGRWFLLSGFQNFIYFSFAALDAMPDLTAVSNPLPAGLFSTCGPMASGEEVGQRHTLMPFFSSTLSTHDYACLAKGVTHDAGLHLELGVGFREQRFAQLRYCPQCAENQKREHGFSTWLRAPNLPGVVACWKHGCALLALSVKAFQPPLPVPEAMADIEAKKVIQGEIWYANAAKNLLASNVEPISGLQFRKVLRDACSQRFQTQYGILTRACKARVAQRMMTVEWPRLVGNLQRCKAMTTERVLTDCLTGARVITPAFALLLALLAYDGDAEGFFEDAARFQNEEELIQKESGANAKRAEYAKFCTQSWVARDWQARADKMFC